MVHFRQPLFDWLDVPLQSIGFGTVGSKIV